MSDRELFAVFEDGRSYTAEEVADVLALPVRQVERAFRKVRGPVLGAYLNDYLWERCAFPAEFDGKRPKRFVYFIQAIDGGPIKIGVTSNWPQRLAGLSAGSPVPLRTLALVRAEQWFEKKLHEFYADERLHNEWFVPSRRLRRFISGLTDNLVVSMRTERP